MIPTWLSQLLFLGITAYVLPYRIVLRPAYRQWRTTNEAPVSKPQVLRLLFAVLVAAGGGLAAHALVLHAAGADEQVSIGVCLFGVLLLALGLAVGLLGVEVERDRQQAAGTEEVMGRLSDGPRGHEMDAV